MPMGKCSTLFYIVDNTQTQIETGLNPIEDFLNNTDSFLTSIFNDFEIEVDNALVNGILEACK